MTSDPKAHSTVTPQPGESASLDGCFSSFYSKQSAHWWVDLLLHLYKSYYFHINFQSNRLTPKSLVDGRDGRRWRSLLECQKPFTLSNVTYKPQMAKIIPILQGTSRRSLLRHSYQFVSFLFVRSSRLESISRDHDSELSLH